MRWFGLNANGDMAELGEFETFDDVCEAINAKKLDDQIWIIDEEGARNWKMQLEELLK